MMGLFSGLCSCLKQIKPAGLHEGLVKRDYVEEDDSSSGGCCGPSFDLRILEAATNYFSDFNLLGHGGFGPVYKGLLPSGEEVAVKRLSLGSSQGLKEFATEVNLLLKIQHRNLVVLLGCCIEGTEKMLVYEYLPNKSLDRFLFDKKTVSLDWRTRFQIITGLARGLLYLHEEAPVRIIHRDIKASNILLDAQLNPKLSDFGLASLFSRDDTHVNTLRISGTYGYMAPEYAIQGILSTKADVFSFGILVLEIVSGRRNHNKELSREKSDLLSYTWRLFQDGKSLDVVDSSLQAYDEDAAVLCIHLGLLCCQASYSDRPDMNTVHLMLSSESFTLPKPGKPGLQGRISQWTTTTTSTTAFTSTNPSDGPTTSTKLSTRISFQEEDSRNSISTSSFGEGR